MRGRKPTRVRIRIGDSAGQRRRVDLRVQRLGGGVEALRLPAGRLQRAVEQQLRQQWGHSEGQGNQNQT